MKSLSLEANKIISQLLDKLGTGIFISIPNEPLQPLKFRVSDRYFYTTEGEGKIIGISYTYDEPEELISTMELTLLVADKRKTPEDYHHLFVWPMRYEHDNLDLDLVSIEIFDDGSYIPIEKYYDGNAEIAEAWLLEFQKMEFTC